MHSGIKEELMESTNKNKHLTLDDRFDIQHGLDACLSFKAIGAQIRKDCTTISKEVRAHIIFERRAHPIAHSTIASTGRTVTTMVTHAMTVQEKTRRNAVPAAHASLSVPTIRRRSVLCLTRRPMSAMAAV